MSPFSCLNQPPNRRTVSSQPSSVICPGILFVSENAAARQGLSVCRSWQAPDRKYLGYDDSIPSASGRSNERLRLGRSRRKRGNM